MNTTKILLFAIYVVAVLLAVVIANDVYAVEKQPQGRPFLLSSRYGRSDGGNNRKQEVVTPRSDKFFLASRYGKRSDVITNSILGHPSDSLPPCGNAEDLSCIYSGVSNLYKCYQKKYETDDEDYLMN